ncbi:hypothetical protein IMAU60201_01226 [Lactobacillus helveticus]|uniref:hypothetical protein n=1 Tax=Lactobacillus helveticus TaxID=1587 RepID=UPI0015626EA4|nr:hypothetical protein [Lactobacillus helveticus]NRO60678.1 hypothetical protein [Lactobacillus helveticus]
MRNIKFVTVFITLITLTAFITFGLRQYSAISSELSRSHNKLPILAENAGTEKPLTEIGILLVGLSAYILVSTFENKTEDKKR